MATEGLGNLFFSLGLNAEKFDKAWKAAMEKYKKEAKIDIKIDIKALQEQRNMVSLTHREKMNALALERREAINTEAVRRQQLITAAKVATEEARAQAVRDKAVASIERANKSLSSQNRIVQNLHTLAASYLSVFAATRLIRNIAAVSGEFEMQRRSLEAIIKNASIANDIFEKTKALAVKSPFQFKELITYSKMLSAYAIPAKDLFETTKMLSDASAGLGVGMDRLVLAYGQIRSAAVLRGQEVRQLTEAGIPIINELKKKFIELGEVGITTADVFDKISARLVPFSMVKEVFEDMTSIGGKFYRMQEIQAETLKGKIANLKDAYELMFYEIGTRGDKVFKGSVDSIRWMIENYKKVSKEILALAISYATYRAAILITNTVMSLHKAFVAANVAANGVWAISIALVRKQFERLWLVMKLPSSWGALIGVAIAALTYGIFKLATRSSEAEKALERYNKAVKGAKDSANASKDKVSELMRTIRDGTSDVYEQVKAFDELIRRYKFFSKYSLEELRKMSDADIKSLLASFGLAQDKGAIQKLIKRQKEIIKGLEIDVTLPTLERDFFSQAAYKKKKGEELEAEKAVLDKLQLDLIRQQNLEEKARIAGLSPKERRKFYKDEIDRLEKLRESMKYTTAGAKNFFEKMSGGGFVFDSITPKIKEYRQELAALTADLPDWAVEINTYLDTIKTIPEGLKTAMGLGVDEGRTNYIARLREEYSEIKAMLLDIGREDPKPLQNKLTALEGIFKILRVSPTAPKEQIVKEQKDVLADLYYKLELELSKATLDAMEDGWEKEMELEKYQHKKRVEQIGLHAKDLLKAQKEEGGSGEVLTQKNQKLIDDLLAEEEKAFAVRQKKRYEDLLDKYADFERRKERLKAKFDEEEVRLNKGKNDENATETERALKVLRVVYNKELQAIVDEEINLLMETSPFLVRLFSDTADLSRKSLKGILADAKKLLEYISGNKEVGLPMGIKPEDAEKMVGNYNSIRRVQKEIMDIEEQMKSKRQYPFASFVNALDFIKDAGKEIRKLQDETDPQKRKDIELKAEALRAKGVNAWGAALSEVGKAINYVADSLERLAEVTDNAKLKETAEQVKGIADIISSAGQGLQSGGWIGAIVGAALSIITQTIDAFIVAKAEEHRYQQDSIDYLNEYRNLLLKIKHEDYESIFGVKTFSKTADAIRSAREALANFNEDLKKRTIPEIEKRERATGIGLFTGSFGGYFYQKVATEDSKLALEAYKKGFTDIQRMAVNVKNQSGWANFFGVKDKYKTLFDMAPQIWGGKLDGEFNVDAAKAFLDTNTQITEEQRKQIQNLIAQKELYNENINIIKDDLKDTFGHIGDSITDAIIQAVTTGADAFSLFEEAGAKAIDKLGKKLVYELFFAQRLRDLQDELLEAVDGESPEKAAMAQVEVMDKFFSSLDSVVGNAEAFAERWKQTAAEKGYSIYGETTDAMRGGIQALTEPTGNLLASYINAMRADVAGTGADIKGIVPVIGNINDIMGNSLAELQMINANTYRSANNTDKIFTKLEALTTVGGATKLNTRVAV